METTEPTPLYTTADVAHATETIKVLSADMRNTQGHATLRAAIAKDWPISDVFRLATLLGLAVGTADPPEQTAPAWVAGDEGTPPDLRDR